MRGLCSLILVFVLNCAIAQSQISPMSLVGRWSASTNHPSGATMVTHVVFTQNMHFFGSSTVDGNTLARHYETSSELTPAPGTTGTDEIISVDASKLVLRSSPSGKQYEYLRAR